MGLFGGDEKKKRSGHKAAVVAAAAAGPDPSSETDKDPGPGVLMPLAGVSAPGATPAGPETDSPPTVGNATTFTGKIVADEDLEALGTVEGSIRLAQHHLTVGISGVVTADGAIVVGALDMKAALPKDLVDPEPPKREAPETVGDVHRARSDDPA